MYKVNLEIRQFNKEGVEIKNKKKSHEAFIFRIFANDIKINGDFTSYDKALEHFRYLVKEYKKKYCSRDSDNTKKPNKKSR